MTADEIRERGHWLRWSGEAPTEPGAPTILAATNGGPRGEAAARRAAEMAAGANLPLVITRILDQDTKEDDAEGAFRLLCDRAEREHGDLACAAEIWRLRGHHVDVERGRAAMLADAARNLNAEAIVLGPHDRAAGKPFTGTMTERLLHLAACPVVIAAKEATGPYRKVLVAVDFSEVSLRAVEAAMRLAPRAEITLLHVRPDDAAPDVDGSGGEESLSNLAAAAKDALVRKLPKERLPSSYDLTIRTQTGKPKEVIPAVHAQIGADLLVMGTKGRTGLSRMVLGSVALKFVDEPPSDVLVLLSRD